MSAYNVHHLPFWRQFNQAVRVRASVLFGTYPDVAPNVGDPLQPAYATGVLGVYLIGDLQQWIEENCHFFLRSHNDNGSKRNPATFFNGLTSQAAIEPWTWETLKTSKLGDAGWTAPLTKTTHTHRRIQAGDMWQPVIFDELAGCFDALLWTKQTLISTYTRATPIPGFDTTIALAKADANSRYDGAEAEAGGDYGTAKNLGVSGDDFSAEIVATKYQTEAEVTAGVLVGLTGYGYLKAVATSETNGSWDAQGDDVVEGQFKSCGSGSVAVGVRGVVGTVGQVLTKPPTWPVDPPVEYPYTIATGWLMSDYFSLCEWAFPILTPLS
jgi:hypothetical protein